ncbi:uncharacterized protein BDW70DRAFT_155196 [Aspergillus foveolatus]|uniref:uncharacterized protein n=1 Tax=Aspergillus foveolatus TaxID=210207 RepID=UPI003CCC95F4
MSAGPVKLAGRRKRSAQEKRLVVGIALVLRYPATTLMGKGKRRRSAPSLHMAELVKRVEILENAMSGLSSKYGVPVEELVSRGTKAHAQNIIRENLDETTREGVETKCQELQDIELKHEGMQAQNAPFKDLSSAPSPGPATQSYADMPSSNQVTSGISSSSVSPASEVQDTPNPYIIPDPQFVHPSAPDMLEPQGFFRQEYNESFILNNDRALQSNDLTMHHSMDTFTTMADSWEQHF